VLPRGFIQCFLRPRIQKLTKLHDLKAKPQQLRDPNAEFDYPCAEARAFYAKQVGEYDESKTISSKTLTDLFRDFDEGN
jgi:hypothetical protein